MEDAIAPSSQTSSALSNIELCEFEKEIVSFQFDCLQVQDRLEVLIDGVETLQGQGGLQEGFVEDLKSMMEEVERLLSTSSLNLNWARQHMHNHNLDDMEI